MDLRKTDIERYSLQADSAWNPGICPDKEGDYVLYTDYLKLRLSIIEPVDKTIWSP
jgi:hypothetical protein